jgi:hypothetical protein
MMPGYIAVHPDRNGKNPFQIVDVASSSTGVVVTHIIFFPAAESDQ